MLGAFRGFMIFGLVVLLSACGGGGGGGGGDSGSAAPPAYSLTLSQNSLTFSVSRDDSSAPTQTITASFVGDGLLVGFPPGQTPPSWLSVTAPQTSSTGQITVVFSVGGWYSLAPGSYTTTVRLVTGKADGSVTVHKDVTVTLDIRDTLRVSEQPQTRSHIWGSTLPTSNVFSVEVNTVGLIWEASSDAAWLQLTNTNGTGTTQLNGTLSEEQLPVGTHVANVQVIGSNGQRYSVPFTLTVTAPSIVVDTALRSLFLINGQVSEQQSISISLDNGAEIDWSALSSDNDWLVISQAAGTTATPVNFRVSAEQPNIGSGIYDGVIQIVIPIPGASTEIEVPVRASVETRRLFVHDNGIALTEVPGSSRLSANVMVRDSLFRNDDLSLHTSSNQSWLTASIVGTREVQVVANPSGLTDGLHYATVQVTSDDPKISNADSIKIGLYVDGNSPVTGNVFTFTAASAPNKVGVVADPIRPYVYLTDYQSTTITALNVYTGATEFALTVPNAGRLTDLTVANDGNALFIQDGNKTDIHVLDLTTRSWLSPLKAGTTMGTPPFIIFVRPDGRDVVRSGNCYIETATNTIIGYFSGASGPCMDSYTFRFNMHQVKSLPIAASSYRDLVGINSLTDKLVLRERGFIMSGDDRDQAVNIDATLSYTLEYGGSGYAFGIYTNTTNTDVVGEQIARISTPAYPQNVETGQSGIWYASTGSGPIRVFNDSASELDTISFTGEAHFDGLRVSQDYLRLIVISSTAGSTGVQVYDAYQ